MAYLRNGNEPSKVGVQLEREEMEKERREKVEKEMGITPGRGEVFGFNCKCKESY